MSRSMTRWGWAIGAIIMVCGWQAPAMPYVMLANGEKKEGTEIRAKPDGTIILTTAQGQFTYTKGQYTQAFADKPADFDKARQLAAAKDYDGAATILKDIVQRNAYLGWDNAARLVLAREVLSARGDFAGAVQVYEDMFRVSPEKKTEDQTAAAYRSALLGAKQFDKLKAMLDEAIAKGSRLDAARAQTMRGDIKMAQGQVEAAALDYLRTVVLFESETEAQPEALFKAADALEKLRDARAGGLYKQIVEKYPASPYAQQAAAKAK